MTKTITMVAATLVAVLLTAAPGRADTSPCPEGWEDVSAGSLSFCRKDGRSTTAAAAWDAYQAAQAPPADAAAYERYHAAYGGGFNTNTETGETRYYPNLQPGSQAYWDHMIDREVWRANNCYHAAEGRPQDPIVPAPAGC